MRSEDSDQGSQVYYILTDHLSSASYGGAVTALAYDYAGRMTSMSDPDIGAWGYTYNGLGNLTSQVVSGQGYSLSYDAESRLVGVTSLDQFADGFESGSFSGWSSSVTDGGDHRLRWQLLRLERCNESH